MLGSAVQLRVTLPSTMGRRNRAREERGSEHLKAHQEVLEASFDRAVPLLPLCQVGCQLTVIGYHIPERLVLRFIEKGSTSMIRIGIVGIGFMGMKQPLQESFLSDS
jgi:hypothetical protein